MTAVATVRFSDVAEVGDAATRADEPLVWLLHRDAVAAGDALEALLAHAGRPAASLPVDAAGRPLEPLLGRFATDDVGALLEAAQRRVVPLRHCHVVSLLLERELVSSIAPPDPRRFGAWAGSEWTARLFARAGGVLVPASRVVAPKPPSPALVPALRMLRTPTWRRGETLRELAHGARRRWS